MSEIIILVSISSEESHSISLQHIQRIRCLCQRSLSVQERGKRSEELECRWIGIADRSGVLVHITGEFELCISAEDFDAGGYEGEELLGRLKGLAGNYPAGRVPARFFHGLNGVGYCVVQVWNSKEKGRRYLWHRRLARCVCAHLSFQ